MTTTVPCAVCKSPVEDMGELENARYGPWCEACFDDSCALGTAMLMCQSGQDAKGHWFYFQEWLQSKERANAQEGLTNCDRCGFPMRLPYPIGDPKLCVHCIKGKTVATEAGAAFLRIPQPSYVALDALRNEMGLDWTVVLKLLEQVLRGARGNEKLLGKIKLLGDGAGAVPARPGQDRGDSARRRMTCGVNKEVCET